MLMRFGSDVLLGCLLVTTAGRFAQVASALQTDGFDGDSLDEPQWQTYNPVGDAQIYVTSSSSKLTFDIPASTDHNMWKGSNNRSPRVYQSINNLDDLEVIVHFDPNQLPTANLKYQMEGIFIRGNSDSQFMRFGSYSDGSSNKSFSAYINGGSHSNASGKTLSSAPDRLKLSCESSTCTYSTATPGSSTFQVHGSLSKPSSMTTVTGIGVYVGNAGEKPAFTTSILEFEVIRGASTTATTPPTPPPTIMASESPTSSPEGEPLSPTAAATGVLFSDTFGSANLDPRWQIFKAGDCLDVSPTSDDCKVYLDGASLIFDLPAGSNHDLYKGTQNNAPRVVQPADDKQDFVMTVKFESQPSEKYQMQGLIAMQDIDTFLRIGCYSNGIQTKYFVALIDGNSVNVIHHGNAVSFPERMRLTRNLGSSWKLEAAAVSSPTFTVIKAFTNAMMEANYVGMYGGTAGDNLPSYLASVDYVEFDSDPIDDTDSPVTVIPHVQDTIEIWSGLTMNYGAHGLGQNWLNIVGRAPSGTISLTYSLSSDCGATFPRTLDSCGLLLGSDGRRLVDDLDFNLELYVEDLLDCTNGGIFHVDLTAQGAYPQTERVTINFTTTSSLLDRSFTADWSSSDINEYGQVLDGNWEVDTANNVVRTKQIGYDRLMTIGDRDWIANYEVCTSFKIYASTIRGVGFAMGWRGHKGKSDGTCNPAAGSLQTTWPLEAITWVHANSHLEIWNFPNAQAQISLNNIAGMGAELVVGQLYHMRSSILPVENGTKNLVKTKIWKDQTDEPDWLLQATPYAINSDTNGSGSILLLCHHTDVEFGPVVVTPLA